MQVQMPICPTDVLLVVDVQNDFCSGGALAVPQGETVVPSINALMPRFHHVVLTQDWHAPDHWSFASAHPDRAPFEIAMLDYGEQILWPNHCVRGTPGADFHRDLIVDRAGLILRKGSRPEIDSYSAFFENDRTTSTGLAGYLRERGIGRVFLAGLATDFCVHYSAVDARRAGFEAVIVEDACRGLDMDGSMQSAKAAMAAAGAIFTHAAAVT